MARASRSHSSPARSYSPPPRPAPSRPSQSSAPSRPSAPAPARAASAPKPAAPAVKAPGGVKTSTAVYGTPAPTAKLATAPAQVKTEDRNKNKVPPITGATAAVPTAAGLTVPKLKVTGDKYVEFKTPSGVKVSAPRGQTTVDLTLKGWEVTGPSSTARGDVTAPRVKGDTVIGADGTRVDLTAKGTSPKVGEFTGMSGLHPQDAVARVPKEWATEVRIGPSNKIAVHVNSSNPAPAAGQPVEVRIHSQDPRSKLDPAANARNYWSGRVQMDREGKQFLSTDDKSLVGRRTNESHIPLSGKAATEGVTEAAGKLVRAGSRAAVAAGLAYDAYRIYNSYQSEGRFGPNTVKETTAAACGWAGGVAGAGVGALVGSAVPVIGTGVGAVVGGIVGAIFGDVAGDTLGEPLNK